MNMHLSGTRIHRLLEESRDRRYFGPGDRSGDRHSVFRPGDWQDMALAIDAYNSGLFAASDVVTRIREHTALTAFGAGPDTWTLELWLINARRRERVYETFHLRPVYPQFYGAYDGGYVPCAS